MAKTNTLNADDKREKDEAAVLNPAIDENPDPRPLAVKTLTEEEVEQGSPEIAPEEGTLGQAPVLTPGVIAPISSQMLPNVDRDARLLLAENTSDVEVKTVESLRADPTSTGARDARDLAKLIEAHPGWVNNLDQLDELERSIGVENPAPWVRNPVDLLEEAKRYNVYFVGENGNFLPR